MEEIFDRVGRHVLPKQNCGLIRFQHKRLGMRQILRGPIEPADSRVILAATLPLVANAKIEFRNEGVAFMASIGGKEIVNHDPVDDC